MSVMQIPFVDLKAQYNAHKESIDSAIKHVIETTSFIGGNVVREFEQAYAEAYGVKHCISVANGTDAIYITLKMLGIGPGDEVITVANSWISTSETISQTGATPVFVDVDDYFHIDVSGIQQKITIKTKAIIPVHIYGQPVNMGGIEELCEKNNLFLIEDCAQSHFAEYDGQRVGTFGIVGTFSFYPGKNLGAYGDAGAVITNDDELASKIRMYANHGALIKHAHKIEGINSRLDGLQAAILSVKLPHIHEWIKARQKVASIYDSLLNNIDEIVIPSRRPKTTHTYHLYVIKTKVRDNLQKYLNDHGVQSVVHYPTALPLLPAYDYLDYRPEEIPVAYKNQGEILSLPIYPEMTIQMVEYVVEKIQHAVLEIS